MKLPEEYLQQMKTLLGSGYDDFIASYDTLPYEGLRVNTSKIDCGEFERIAPYHIEKIPYTDNGYYIDDTDAWCKHPYYFAGLYYIQEPSAMLPAHLMPVDVGDIVCDLCAAPGGKSTALSCKDPGILLSNDISFSRTIPLVKNMELAGSRNYLVSCESPRKLAAHFPETFNRILVDAPCSGEGMFRKDPGLIGSYAKRGPKDYAPLQREILEYAYAMLCPGGSMLYSTCTFSDIEDEQVIDAFISSHKDLEVTAVPKTDGLLGPYGGYSDNDRIAGCVHALPHLFRGEGHFAALIIKSGVVPGRTALKAPGLISYNKLSEKVKEFSACFSEEFLAYFKEKAFIQRDDGYVYMMPDMCAAVYDKSIRYVRTGVCVGRIGRGGRFTVNTAFALSIRHDDFLNTIDYSADNPDVIKYLKGETVILEGADNVKGHVLVCVDSYPLGFAYSDGTKLKNLYEKGWVYK